MKKMLFFMVCLVFATFWTTSRSFASAPIVPNGGFEKWNMTGYSYPAHYPYNSNEYMFKLGSPQNVTLTTDCYHGTSAVKLVTDSLLIGVLPGFIGNAEYSDEDPETWTGGIAIDQPITGIRGWYKYDFNKPDSALIIVELRHQSTYLGSYSFYLKEKKTEWTLFDFDIVPTWPSSLVPDTISIGFVSSGLGDGENNYPAGSTLLLDSISLKGLSVQPEALNGDFEQWDQHATFNPESWFFNPENKGDTFQTSDCIEGNYAIRLSTNRSDGEIPPTEVPQQLILGNLTIEDANLNWTGNIVLRPYAKDTLSFWYKYLPTKPGTTGGLQMIYMQKGILSEVEFVSLPAASAYREVKVPLHDSPVSSGCDALYLLFSSTQEEDTLLLNVGSTLYLDNITMIAGDTWLNQPLTNQPFTNEGFEEWATRTMEYPTHFEFNSNLIRARDQAASFNLTRSPAAQHGSYALRMESDNWPESPNFGFIVTKEQQDEPQSWHGGIPITERPTGLRGYYMYQPASIDTALMFIAFSKSGINIGSYSLALKRTTPDLPISSNYTLFELTFSPALTETPDSVAIGFATGTNTNSNQEPGNVLLLDNISLTGVSQQPEKWNGDFEEWTTVTMETPAGWTLQDDDPLVSNKTTHSVEGHYALELRTMLDEGKGDSTCSPSWVSNGYWNRTIQNWAGGSPFLNASIDTLAFWYDYLSPSSDTAQVMVMFKHDGAITGFVGAPLPPTTGYQYKELTLGQVHFNLPVVIPMSADSVLLIFVSGSWNGDPKHAGSLLRIDDVHFLSSRRSSELPVLKTEDESILYPNPTNGPVHLRFNGIQPDLLQVYSLSGQLVLQLTKEKMTNDVELDLGNQTPGVYLIRIMNNHQIQRLKLLLK